MLLPRKQVYYQPQQLIRTPTNTLNKYKRKSNTVMTDETSFSMFMELN